MNKMLMVGGGLAALALSYAAKIAYTKLFGHSDTIPKLILIDRLILMR